MIVAELVERYVHQVGRYLPPKERAEIEAELRSQIQDQLDDRYGGSPSQGEIASVLAEFGHPYMVATSYSADKYLVGPLLYPYMMMVLRYGWLLVPATVVFLSVFGALIAPQPRPLPGLVIETVIAVVQATLIFSAVVVLFFALIQHSHLKINAKDELFNPLDLPKVDDPAAVDRFETAFGIAFGTVVTLVLLYWLQVGGLTLRFNLSDPGEVIPVPIPWLILLIVAGTAMILLHLPVLRRNRWDVGTWLAQTVLEVFGAICFYFAVTKPFFERLLTANPDLKNIAPIARGPEIIAIIFAVVTLIGGGTRLVKLWNYRAGSIEAQQNRSFKGRQ
jgi:hypothetical protein